MKQPHGQKRKTLKRSSETKKHGAPYQPGFLGIVCLGGAEGEPRPKKKKKKKKKTKNTEKNMGPQPREDGVPDKKHSFFREWTVLTTSRSKNARPWKSEKPKVRQKRRGEKFATCFWKKIKVEGGGFGFVFQRRNLSSKAQEQIVKKRGDWGGEKSTGEGLGRARKIPFQQETRKKKKKAPVPSQERNHGSKTKRRRNYACHHGAV